MLVLPPQTYAAAEAGCKALGETLWGAGNSSGVSAASIQPLLDYLVYRGEANATTLFWTAAHTVDAQGHTAAVDKSASDTPRAALCTQSAPASVAVFADTDARWRVAVRAAADRLDNGAGGVADFVGFRDHNTFRFQGIRYAAEPQRWTYATPFWNRTAADAFARDGYNVTVPVVDATRFSDTCAQTGGGVEDCLFLNVFTPYLPASPATTSKQRLRPVLFWIHGGAYTNGAGSDPTYDGGNMAARGDVVVVSINYRLSTLGFLALDAAHGNLRGNYGLADQQLALDWVHDHIAAFGGDPARITIAGQSAGAASVRTMMASPRALGKFTGALLLSNLGGLNYGTTYSRYYTIDEAMAAVARPILTATKCAGPATGSAVVACLRALPLAVLQGASTVARYVVVDGTYIVSKQLDLSRAGASNATNVTAAAPYALMMGTMRDDGTPLASFPAPGVTAADDAAYLSAEGYPNVSAALFPVPGTSVSANVSLDLFNMSSRVSTDGVFRCADTATVHAGLQSGLFPKAYYYEFHRAYQTTGWPGLDVCNPPATPQHPAGDPARPYFCCHSGELYYVFGNIARQGLPWRDAHDQPFSQLALDAFAAFVRTADPNPDPAFLRARGPAYAASLAAREAPDGTWMPATRAAGNTMRILDWPPRQSAFSETEQCASLGLGLDYYMR